ncbi:MAG: hypothetical protein Q9167_007862, partial [Letrouitia subvulpina]
MSQQQLDELKEFHRLLDLALVNIVERWWRDKEARFPERMPLERHEEEVLQEGHHRVCEINARFSFNAYMHTAYGQQAHMDMDDAVNPRTKPVVHPQTIFKSLFSLFDPYRPLHLLNDAEDSGDLHLFIAYLHKTTGVRPRIIKPSQLRLLDDPSSPTGYALYSTCPPDAKSSNPTSQTTAKHTLTTPTIVNPTPDCSAPGKDPNSNPRSEPLEPITQLALEAQQHELHLPPLLLRTLSLHSFNDLRTIYLVHDKRML